MEVGEYRFTVDEAFARAFGLNAPIERMDLKLEQVVAMVHADDRSSLVDAINEAIVRGGAETQQYRLCPADGHYRCLKVSGRVEEALDGTPVRFHGALIDVEERLVAEAERGEALTTLRKSNEALEQLVGKRTRELHEAQRLTQLALSSVGGCGAWTYDIAGDQFFCGPAVCEIHDLDPARAERGIKVVELIGSVHPDDKATLAQGLQKSGDLELEYRICHSNGSIRWVLSCSNTCRDDTGPNRRVGLGIDTTKHHKIEEQLRQMQKMEAVGQLTSGLAHDFNNLLTGITGALDVMSNRLAQGRYQDVDRFLGAAQGAAGRAAALTHRLLAFSRHKACESKPTDVNMVVKGMDELIRRSIGPPIELTMIEGGGLWSTLSDPFQLENALLNLCINARDAMPRGGLLTVETGNSEIDESTASLYEMAAGQYVALCVSDTGTGMPQETIAKAFDPFFTTKPSGQGTGLGLSMVYGFVRQAGGQVRIHSKIAQGTDVCIYLPRYTGKVEGPEVLLSTSDVPRAGGGETVLVVDDEPIVRLLVTEVLEELGYTAIGADDGDSGLKVLESNARISLLVTDVGLPGGMSGRQMADAARAVRPDLKILLITGYSEDVVVGDRRLEPGMHLMTKPFAMKALATRIRELIAET